MVIKRVKNLYEANDNSNVTREIALALQKAINIRKREIGVFAEHLRTSSVYDIPDNVSLKKIADTANNLGYRIYVVQFGWLGTKDYLIVDDKYDIEDYCRLTNTDISELGKVAERH